MLELLAAIVMTALASDQPVPARDTRALLRALSLGMEPYTFEIVFRRYIEEDAEFIEGRSRQSLDDPDADRRKIRTAAVEQMEIEFVHDFGPRAVVRFYLGWIPPFFPSPSSGPMSWAMAPTETYYAAARLEINGPAGMSKEEAATWLDPELLRMYGEGRHKRKPRGGVGGSFAIADVTSAQLEPLSDTESLLLLFGNARDQIDNEVGDFEAIAVKGSPSGFYRSIALSSWSRLALGLIRADNPQMTDPSTTPVL